jgi:chemotaxis protein histidine kinase CheA/ActR/RegA family two-component response regulator
MMQSEINAKIAHILALQSHRLASDPVQTGIAECLTAWQEFIELLTELDLLGLTDLLTFYCQLLESFAAQKNNFSAAEQLFLQQGATLFQALFQDYATNTVDALLDYLQQPAWLAPISGDDAQCLRDLLINDCLTLPALESKSDLLTDPQLISCAEAEINFCPLDPQLIELATVSVEPELTAMIGEQIKLVACEWQQPEWVDLAALLEKTLDTITPIANAAEMLNLWGIRQLLIGFERNLLIYQADSRLLEAQICALIKTALELMSDYFADISNPAHAQALITVFTDLEWPYCLTETEQDFLTQLFSSTKLAEKEVISEEQAQVGDISLLIPDDVDPELLEMMLSELPLLSAQFSEVLQQIINEANLEALAVARRLAHTLKGLASMVGVRGVANLTHALENILELLAQRSQLPNVALSDYLLAAADCIDGMNESLQTKTPAPDNALAMLQQLHHCFYQLRTDQSIENSAPALQSVSALSQTPPSPQPVMPSADAEEQNTEEAFVRISKTALNNLLRIAGESSTLNAQLNEQLQHIKLIVKNSRERYRTQQKIIAELEEHVNSQFTLSPALIDGGEEFDPLEMDRYNYLHSGISRLYEAIADSREIEMMMAEYVRQLGELLASQTGLQKENLAEVVHTRLLAVQSLTPRLQRILRQACRSANKKARLIIAGEELLMDGQVLNQLADPLMHIIRNAVDHGLEDALQRFEKAKPETGTIKLNFSRSGEVIHVRCEDDGQGLNHQAIRAAAIQKGLIDENTVLTPTELDRLILLPGFSTKTEVSQLSGRGIGMDVVYQEIRHLKGSLEIKSIAGQGCRFHLTLPSSSLMLKALLVQCGQQVLSLASYGIKQSVLSLDGKISTTAEGGLQFIHQGETYQVVSIEALTGNKPVDYLKLRLFPVLFVNSTAEQKKVAIFVSAMLAHKEVVFKDMGIYIPHLPGIFGVTILPSGQISPLIDLTVLINQQTRQNPIFDDMQPVADYKLPTLLIVDDSLSARKAISVLLKDNGYLIQTAIDGVEALNKIQQQPPDLVITDYEMPRMNGVELASVIKNREKIAHLPIIMITSRSTDKHRKEAIAAGVDYYLTKPWQESTLLDVIAQLLSNQVITT